MSANFGLDHLELAAVHVINPETAAHNIALAYVTSAANSTSLYNGEDAISHDVLSLSNQYIQAYNYAYNFVVHENNLTKDAE